MFLTFLGDRRSLWLKKSRKHTQLLMMAIAGTWWWVNIELYHSHGWYSNNTQCWKWLLRHDHKCVCQGMYLFLPTGEREYEATNSVSSCLLLFTWYWKRWEYYYYSDQWQLNKHFLHEREQRFRSWCWRRMWVIEFVVSLLLSLLLVLFFAPRGFSPLQSISKFQFNLESTVRHVLKTSS